MEEQEWKSIESAPNNVTVLVKDVNGVIRDAFISDDGWYGRLMHHIFNRIEVPIGWKELKGDDE